MARERIGVEVSRLCVHAVFVPWPVGFQLPSPSHSQRVPARGMIRLSRPALRGVLCGPPTRLANGRRAISELAGPALDPSIVKFLQVVPPLAFQVVILAPVQAIRRFREEGTTGSVSPVPYAAMCSNGAIWMSCKWPPFELGPIGLKSRLIQCSPRAPPDGFLQGDPTIYLSNIPALLMGGLYAQQFAAHRAPDAPSVLPVYCGFGGIAATCGAIALTQPPEAAAMAIGYIGSGVCVAMFSGPLLSIRAVLRERSARSIPPAFSVASTANCALWSAYGFLVINDPFIWLPNAAGFAAGVTQLGLYLHFGAAAPASAAPTGAVGGDAAADATGKGSASLSDSPRSSAER